MPHHRGSAESCRESEADERRLAGWLTDNVVAAMVEGAQSDCRRHDRAAAFEPRLLSPQLGAGRMELADRLGRRPRRAQATITSTGRRGSARLRSGHGNRSGSSASASTGTTRAGLRRTFSTTSSRHSTFAGRSRSFPTESRRRVGSTHSRTAKCPTPSTCWRISRKGTAWY